MYCHTFRKTALFIRFSVRHICDIFKKYTLSFSLDGIPFLMHDSTMRRTTNIADIYPARILEDPSMFNWTDLSLLNAGEWFVEVSCVIIVFFYLIRWYAVESWDWLSWGL